MPGLNMKDPKFQKLFLLVVGVAFVSYVWYAYLFRPGVDDLMRTKAELEEVQADLEAIRAKAATYDELVDEYEAMIRSFAPVRELLPEEENLTEFLNRLHNTAKTNNVVIDELTPGAWISFNSYAAHEFSLSVSGKYHDIGRFFSGVANFPFIVNVSDVSLHAGGGVPRPISEEEEETPELKVVADFKLHTYRIEGGTG